MNDKWLRSFLAVAETGSVTAAALRSRTPPSAFRSWQLSFRYFQKLYDIRSWCLMRRDHPLAGKTSIEPKNLGGNTLATSCVSLLRYLQIFLENTGIRVDFQEVESNRSSIIEACDAGSICFLNGNIANEFSGFLCIPLDFDTHVQSGLACRENMYPAYKPFFDAAIEVSKTFSWGE